MHCVTCLCGIGRVNCSESAVPCASIRLTLPPLPAPMGSRPCTPPPTSGAMPAPMNARAKAAIILETPTRCWQRVRLARWTGRPANEPSGAEMPSSPAQSSWHCPANCQSSAWRASWPSTAPGCARSTAWWRSGRSTRLRSRAAVIHATGTGTSGFPAAASMRQALSARRPVSSTTGHAAPGTSRAGGRRGKSSST